MTELHALHNDSKRSLRPVQIVAWILVIFWCACIFFMSAHTGNDLDSGSGFIATVKAWLQTLLTPLFGAESDVASVLGHFSEYLVLGALLTHALRYSPSLSTGALIAIALALGSFYGVTDELHQIFVPGRVCDVADWITDTLGCAVGILGFVGLRAANRRRGAVRNDCGRSDGDDYCSRDEKACCDDRGDYTHCGKRGDHGDHHDK